MYSYTDEWEPSLSLERDPTNPEDKCTVAIQRCSRIVGHVPFNLAPVVSAFLKRSSLIEVTGNEVNQGKSLASIICLDQIHTLRDLQLLWISNVQMDFEANVFIFFVLVELSIV